MTKSTIWKDGEDIEVDTSALDLPNDPGFVIKPTRVFKADIWKRCTDAEYDAIQAVIAGTPPRIQGIFRDANYLSVDDDLYPLVLAGASQAVGAERAAELLEPTE